MFSMLVNETISYSDGVKGFPSFYSFLPDFMMGMNSFFYSFKDGNLWRHNTNSRRNSYYGVDYTSSVTGVFNIDPLTVKVFKTMSIESDDTWTCTNLLTDLSSGSMLNTYFEQKEGEWFTYIRPESDTINYKFRSSNGIGVILTAVLTSITNEYTYTFDNPVGNIISQGDIVYFGTPAGGVISADLVKGGAVVSVNNATKSINVNIVGGTLAQAGDFMLYYKNVVAESSGARGYFMQFTLENNNTAAVEMFSVGSSIMKSYP